MDMNLDYQRIGEDFLSKDMYKEAIRFFTKVIDSSQDANAYTRRGFAYHCLLYYEEALENYNASINLSPTAEACYQRGLLYFTRQEYQLASHDFLKAVELDAEEDSYRHYAMLALSRAKRFEEAIEMGQIVRKNDPQNIDVLWEIGWCYAETGNHEIAIQYYLRALKIQPQSATLHNNVAFSALCMGNLKLCELSLKECLRLDEYNAYAIDNMGELEYKRQNYSVALAHINRSLELDSSNAYAYRNKALVYLALNQKEEAKENLEIALELGYTEYFGLDVETLMQEHFPNP
jgi:tetratricopeptide (TPR) repeat protein